MKQPASTFPGHRFDFGDAVYIASIQGGGHVNGIHEEDGSWVYRISGHTHQFWDEDELEPACPQCFQLWDGLNRCPSCGFSYDD